MHTRKCSYLESFRWCEGHRPGATSWKLTQTCYSQAIVAAFLKNGACVHSIDIEKDHDNKSSQLHQHICDVADRDAIRTAVNKATNISGHALNILVNNVAIQTHNGVAAHELDVDVWDRHIAVNLTSYFLFAKNLIPNFLAGGNGGAIVNISSVQGLQSQKGIPAYAATKGGNLLKH